VFVGPAGGDAGAPFATLGRALFAFRGITQGCLRVRVRLWPTPSLESSTLTKN
jgi:hypothetical protein